MIFGRPQSSREYAFFCVESRKLIFAQNYRNCRADSKTVLLKKGKYELEENCKFFW